MENLVGSEKQITWASKIKTERLAELENVMDGKPMYGYDEKGCPNPCIYDFSIADFKKRAIKRRIVDVDEKIQICIDGITSNTDAVWWIDNRNGCLPNIIATKLRTEYLPKRK